MALPDAGADGTNIREPDAADLWARIGLFLGPAAFAAYLLLPPPEGLSVAGHRVAALTILMAIWWMTEAIPLAATSLIPIVMMPLMGVMPAARTTAAFGDDIIFLFLGGFCIALAMQRWGLHRRLALAVVDRVGTGPRSLVWGFMLATAFLSMWMSNTATTMMMLPIGVAVLAVIETDGRSTFGGALTMAIAYASSIGGMATLIGTPPNAIFAGAVQRMTGRTVGFVDWMTVGVPLAAVMLVITWWLLVRVIYPLPAHSAVGDAADNIIHEQRSQLGPMRYEEKVVAVVFALTALAWIMREPKNFGAFVVPGINSVFPMVRDSSIAIAGALALFLVPISLREREFVLNWEWAAKLPWEVLLIFGGGLALASGFDESGLSGWIGERMTAFQGMPPLLLIALIVVVVVALSELASNTATATMAMPIMAAVAAGTGMDPVLLMATAALASSMSFMLPISTPPNAIAFAVGHIRIPDMVRAGVRIDLVGIVLITLFMYFVFGLVFGIAM